MAIVFRLENDTFTLYTCIKRFWELTGFDMTRQIPDFRRSGLKIGFSENLHFIQRESLDIAITVVRCPT